MAYDDRMLVDAQGRPWPHQGVGTTHGAAAGRTMMGAPIDFFDAYARARHGNGLPPRLAPGYPRCLMCGQPAIPDETCFKGRFTGDTHQFHVEQTEAQEWQDRSKRAEMVRRTTTASSDHTHSILSAPAPPAIPENPSLEELEAMTPAELDAFVARNRAREGQPRASLSLGDRIRHRWKRAALWGAAAVFVNFGIAEILHWMGF